MSYETWRQEFYPVSAIQVEEKDALDHSLHKWEGLSPQKLAKHGLIRSGARFLMEGYGGEVKLRVDASSCALCFHHFKELEQLDDEDDLAYRKRECHTCPLAKVRGGHPCDVATPQEGAFEDPFERGRDPYAVFEETGDAEPMIYWLKKAKEVL